MKELLMFADEAGARRREVHAEIRRERMRKERPNAIELTGSPLAASPATGGSDVE